MVKKSFDSQLFRRKINIYEPDYWSIVHAGTLFRIKELETANCSCFKCKQDLEKYTAFYVRLRSASLLPQNK